MAKGNKAKDLHDKEVRIGRIGDLKVVQNQDPHPAANKHYYALRIQDSLGQEYNALFTENELARAMKRAKKNPEDVPVAENLYDKLKDLLDWYLRDVTLNTEKEEENA